MDTPPPLADSPQPSLRACDGAPWPSDADLAAEADWSSWLQAHTGDASMTDAAAIATTELCVAFPADPYGSESVDPGVAAVSDLDARLGHLEFVVAARHRAAAEEGRLIAAMLHDAAADPAPWVGPDPTLDLAWSDARGRTVAAVRRDRVDLAQRAAVAEIAVRLRVSEQTVRTRATHVEVLHERCPTLWQRFVEGRTSERHAFEAARLASSLPHDDAEAWAAFDDGAASLATALVPTKFAVAARALRERVHAESLEARHQRAARDRGVWMTPELDGMASLNALLPADRARSLMTRLDHAARHLHAAPDEERTLAQLRADVLADLVAAPHEHANDAAMTPASDDAPARAPHGSSETTAPASDDAPARATHGSSETTAPASGDAPARATRGSSAGGAPPQRTSSSPVTTNGAAPAPDNAAPPPPRHRRRPSVSPAGTTVVVTVPALTLLGAGDDPPTLEGYGPIDLDTARRLAGEARSWVRLLTHPVTGAPLVMDRKTYRVPAALRRWLGVTSPTCVFPGCNRAARNCDLDHLTAWADGGTTDADNLEPECRHHHRLRHDSRWAPTDDSTTGTLTWTSPLGATYDADPPPF